MDEVTSNILLTSADSAAAINQLWTGDSITVTNTGTNGTWTGNGLTWIEGPGTHAVLDEIEKIVETLPGTITLNMNKKEPEEEEKPIETFVGTMRVLQQDSDLLYSVEIEVMRDGVNRNNWDYRNMDLYADTFKGMPILTAYVGRKIGDGHNMDERVDKDGQTYYSTMSPTAERIVGMIGDGAGDIRVEERNGHRWIIARGKLWRFYHRELVDKIASQGRMSVSAETEVFEMEKKGNSEVYTNWRGLGVTILGDDVPPAIPGANVRALSEMRDEFEKMKIRAAQLISAGKTEGVKRRMNKNQLAELEKKFGEGCRVLAADDTHVCLLKNGDPCTYVFENADETIVPEHFQSVQVNAVYVLNDGTQMDMDIGDYNAVMLNMLSECEADKKHFEKRALEAEEKVRKMQESEKNRRISAVKSALHDRLKELECEMGMKDCEDLCGDLCGKANEYAEEEDENGEFCGDKKACAALDALCMNKMMTAAKAKRASEKKTLAWNLDLNEKTGDGLDGSIERLMRN